MPRLLPLFRVPLSGATIAFCGSHSGEMQFRPNARRAFCGWRASCGAIAMFAVSQFTTMPVSAAEDLRLYGSTGVDAIEICEAKYPPSRLARFDLIRRIRDHDFAITSLQPEVHSIFPDRMAKTPRRVDDRLDAFLASIDFWTKALNVPGLPFVLIAGVGPDQNLREGWAEARRFIQKAAQFAEERDARIAFEPLGPSMMYFDTFIYGLDQGVKLVEEAESDAAGLVVDAWHVWEERDLERRLTEIANKVLVCHACDWPEAWPRCLDDRKLPGDGIIPLRSKIFEPLRAGGFEAPFVIEVLSDQSLPDSLWNLHPEDLLLQAKASVASQPLV